MSTVELLWAGFGVVWLGVLVGLACTVAVRRARSWSRFRAAVRSLEHELATMAGPHQRPTAS